MSGNTFDNDLPPWLLDDDDDQSEKSSGDVFFGGTAQLPWRQEAAQEDNGAGTDGLPSLDWGAGAAAQESRPADPFKGLTGMLPWKEQETGTAQSADYALPEWLRDEAPAAGSFDQPLGAPSSDDMLPDWMLDEQPIQAASPTPVDDDLPEWLRDEEPNLAAQAGAVFLSDVVSPSPSAEESLPSWFAEAPDESSVGSFDFGDTAPPAAEPVPSDESLPAWLMQTDSEDFAARSAEAEIGFQPPASEPEDELNWMAQDEQPEPAGEMSYEDWVRQNLPAEEQDDLNWLAEPQSPFGGTSGMTYEEWERQQIEAERAATAEPEIPLPDDLPDLLASIEETGDLTPSAATDYVPEWFMGVEELDASAAPDWLKDTDLVGGVFKPPSKPLPAPPSPDLPAPDLGAVIGDLPLPDFSSVTGETPPPPAPPKIKRLGSSPLPPTGDIPPLALDDLLMEEEPAPNFDDLFGAMPATSDLLGGETVSEQPIMEAAATDEPDWLRGYDQADELAQLEAQQPFQPEETVSSSPDALPDWFQSMDFSAVSPPPAPILEAAAPPPEDAFDLDSLLSSELGLPSAAPIAASDLVELSSPTELRFDEDFLSGFQQPARESFAPPEAVELEPAELEESEVLPGWVQGVRTAGDEVVLKAGGVESRFAQVPPVLLPQELRDLREQVADYLAQPRQRGRPIEQGILAGVEGALEVDPDLVTPGALTLDKVYNVTDSQQMRLETLQRVLEIVRQETDAQRIEIRFDLEKEEDAAQVEEELKVAPKAARYRVRRKPDRWLITLLLVVVMGLPFATNGFHLADDPPISLDEEAQPIAAAIDALAEQPSVVRKPVLVAFEYSPATSHELEPLAEAVLRDVLAHEGVPVAVSTNPMGVLQARELLARLAEDEALLEALRRRDPLEMPEDYVVLRYLTGGAVGVRSLIMSPTTMAAYFARDFSGEETDLQMDSLNPQDFAFVVVVGERYEDTRLWAEQLKGVALPKFVLVTSAAEPITRPYVNAGAYNGMLSGIRGSLMYDAARNARTKAPYESDSDLPDPDLARWHSAALGALLAAVFIGLGGVYNLLRTLRKVRRRAE